MATSSGFPNRFMGTALALGSGAVFTDPDSSAQQGAITESTNLQVSSYKFVYTPSLTEVSAVTVSVTNSDRSSAHEAVVHVSLGNSANTVLKTGTSDTLVEIPSGATEETEVQLKENLALTDLDWIRVLVEEEKQASKRSGSRSRNSGNSSMRSA